MHEYVNTYMSETHKLGARWKYIWKLTFLMFIPSVDSFDSTHTVVVKLAVKIQKS